MAKPVVDGIEAQYPGRLIVLRVDVQDPAGKALARDFNFRLTPTFIFLDPQGNEMWRSVGQISSEKVAESMR